MVDSIQLDSMFSAIIWWDFPSGPPCPLPSHGPHRLEILMKLPCATVERKLGLHQQTRFQVSRGPNEIWNLNHCCVYQKLNVSARFWWNILAELWKVLIGLPDGAFFPWVRDPQWCRLHRHVHGKSKNRSCTPGPNAWSGHVRDLLLRLSLPSSREASIW